MAKAGTLTKLEGGRLLSPIGTAAFAYLDRPDTSFNNPRHKITVFFMDKDAADFKAFVKKLRALAKQMSQECGRKVTDIPIKKANEKTAKTANVPVGTPYVEVTTKVDPDNYDPIPVYNAANELQTGLQVWGGDIVRVSVTVKGWEQAAGAGIKAYLNKVQLLKSMGQGGGGSPFDVVDEYLDDDDAPDPDVDPDSFEEEEDPDDIEEADGDDPTDGLL
jgi:hypothetical protein